MRTDVAPPPPRLQALCPHGTIDPVHLCTECDEAIHRRAAEWLQELVHPTARS